MKPNCEKHQWVYLGGHTNILWFYCSKCHQKRTDVNEAFNIFQFRVNYIKAITK